MPYRYKKKKYKLKPQAGIAISIIVLVLILIIVFIFWRKNENKAENSSNINSSNSQSSSNSLDDIIIETESLPSTPSVSSLPNSPSSEIVFTASSKPVSQQASKPASKPPVSKPVSSALPNKDSAATGVPWNLILLNRDSVISRDMSFEKTKFDSQYIDSRVAPAYQKMCDGAKSAGITLFLRSGYRSIKTQTVNYNAEVNRYMNLGNNKKEATRLTDQYYAKPGASEHHSGLALDIITPEYHRDVYTLNERFEKTEAFTWLAEHAPEYGFILRYQRDKVDVTKINYEPWHYRYVGVDVAKYMQKNNLCFEEYMSEVQIALKDYVFSRYSQEQIDNADDALQETLEKFQQDFVANYPNNH